MNKERTILYLFSINAIIYIASGFYTPFLSAYYAQKGIDAEKIGILLMIGPCVVLLTQRFWAKISDRTGKRKEVLLVTIVGSGFSMLLYYLGNSFLCMFFATVVVTSFTTAVIPLSDAILIARSLKEGYSYSIIRLGGTLGYAVMTICAGMYLKTRPQMQFVFAFFAYMILFCFCIGLSLIFCCFYFFSSYSPTCLLLVNLSENADTTPTITNKIIDSATEVLNFPSLIAWRYINNPTASVDCAGPPLVITLI